MLNIALVGCGEHSRGSHAAPLHRYATEHPDEISLVAACDINLDRAREFCREFGFARPYQSLETMLAQESVDGCVAVMPVNLIAEVGSFLLKRGIPSVIEKPLGASLEEAEGLATVARQTGSPHMVSVNRRFLPYLNQAVAWAGEQGPLQYVRATMVREKRSEPDFIWSTAVHAVDALRHIAGEVEDYDVKILGRENLSTQWYVISLRFQDGTLGQIEVLPTAGIIEESYDLFGEGYRAQVIAGSGSQRSLQCWSGSERKLLATADSEPEDVRNGGYAEVVEFVNALKGGSRPGPTIQDVVPSMRICFSISEQAGAKSLG